MAVKWCVNNTLELVPAFRFNHILTLWGTGLDLIYRAVSKRDLYEEYLFHKINEIIK